MSTQLQEQDRALHELRAGDRQEEGERGAVARAEHGRWCEPEGGEMPRPRPSSPTEHGFILRKECSTSAHGS